MDIKSLITSYKVYAPTPAKLFFFDKLRIALAYYSTPENFYETNQVIAKFAADPRASSAYIIFIKNPSYSPTDSDLFYMYLARALVNAIEPKLDQIYIENKEKTTTPLSVQKLKPISDLLMNFANSYLDNSSFDLAS